VLEPTVKKAKKQADPAGFPDPPFREASMENRILHSSHQPSQPQVPAAKGHLDIDPSTSRGKAAKTILCLIDLASFIPHGPKDEKTT
jgi:hypothetical protein